MSRVSFADLIATDAAVSVAEGVALTLAVADALAACHRHRVPADAEIVLDSTGHVLLDRVTASTPGHVTAELAALLRRLLQLDHAAAGDRRRRVPGQLLVLLARARGQTEAPPDVAAFREELAAYGSADPSLLAAVFWGASHRRARLVSRKRPPPHAAAVARDDRRDNMPTPAELRRYLRETERELYETRRQSRPRVAQPAAATAPRPARRMVRKSIGTAATIAGAVVGTLLAFMLADTGVLDRRGSQAASSPPARAAAQPPVAAVKSDRPIRTSRTVQPLLLAASVGADVFSPSFAPEGRTILFHAGRQSSPLMRASVTEAGEVSAVEKLLDDGAANYHVTMSPDGSRIAYDSDRDGVRGVYVANADGTAPRRMSGTGYASVPSWSPDGRRLAFARAEPGRMRVWNIWIAGVDSGQLRRITRHPVGQPWGASWFPDGRQIAYSLEDRLMVADLQSGMARGYRSPRAGRLVRTPAVSPDGRRIVFQVERDGVWLLDVPGANLRRILADVTAEEFVWSPDGTAIAYHARQGGSYGLWRLALDTGAN